MQRTRAASAREPVTGPTPIDFFVSPQGNDAWSGRLADPAENDGPFATLERARDALREAKKAGRCSGGGTVWLKSGVYELHRTFTLGLEDSGTAARRLPRTETRLHSYTLREDRPVAR